MPTWVSRIDRSYANHAATKTCGTCKGSGEIVATDILGPCYCVTRKLEQLSPDAGIERLKAFFSRTPLRKAG